MTATATLADHYAAMLANLAPAKAAPRATQDTWRAKRNEQVRDALAAEPGADERLITVLVPVSRNRRSLLLGQTILVEEWDYENQTTLRAAHPNVEKERAMKEGRLQSGNTDKSSMWATPAMCRAKPRYIELDSHLEVSGDMTGADFAVYGDIAPERAKARARYHRMHLPCNLNEATRRQTNKKGA
jgi:hypothetical protein